MGYTFDEVIKTGEALIFCKNNSVEITKSGLGSAAFRLGFGRKIDNHWEFDVKGLKNFIDMKTDQPEKGWSPISDISISHNLSKKRIYSLIKNGKIKSKYFLSDNKTFVNSEEIKMFIKQRRQNDK